MAIAEIDAWLNGGRDFNQGKLIYQRLGENELIKQQLNFPENSFLRKKLLNALNELNAAAKEVLKVKVAASQSKTIEPARNKVVVTTTASTRPKIDYDNLPDILKARVARKAKCWAEMNHHIYNLKIDAVEKNVILIKKIKLLDKEIDGIWKELDYYTHTGELLIEIDEHNKPRHLLQRDLLNARSNVSRYKAKPGKEKLYTKWNNEMLRLTELLDEPV